MSERLCLAYTVYNRAPLLRKSLERVAELTLPDEIIVVDDGSSDGCEEMVDEFKDRLPVRYVYNHRPYLAMCSQARNVALRAASDCPLFVSCEPEVSFRSDIVAQMRAQHEKDQAQTFPPLQQFINVGRVWELPEGGGEGHEHVNWQCFWCAMWRREWLLDVGGWDESFPSPWGFDDVDLGTRLRIRGIGQYNDWDMTAEHQWHPKTVISQGANEAHFARKGFNGNERLDHPELVANQGREWGVRIARP